MRKIAFLVFGFLYLLCARPAQAADWYVSPNASASGNGSQSNPWTIQKALSHPSGVNPGDTIWLRGGVYRGRFTSSLRGAQNSPIIVRQYPGERATLDANWTTTLVNGVSSTDGSMTFADTSFFGNAAVVMIGN